jgi:hypothetical protein
MTRYEIKTDRRIKERRQDKWWLALKYALYGNTRLHQRRMPKFAAVNHTTGHYVVYK